MNALTSFLFSFSVILMGYLKRLGPQFCRGGFPRDIYVPALPLARAMPCSYYQSNHLATVNIVKHTKAVQNVHILALWAYNIDM